jgi:hypothetical protein
MPFRLVLVLTGVIAGCHGATPPQCQAGTTLVGGECKPNSKPSAVPSDAHPAASGGGLHNKGEWTTTGTYATNEVVTSGGISYICSGAQGCTGIPVNNSLYWQKVPEGQQPGEGAPPGGPGVPGPVPAGAGAATGPGGSPPPGAFGSSGTAAPTGATTTAPGSPPATPSPSTAPSADAGR